MKNKVYQLIWKIRKSLGLTPKINRFAGISDRVDQMWSKLKQAKFFGGVDVVIFGDSNGENISYDDLSQFDKVSVNFAIGGTRADTWVNFFSTKEGKEIYEEVKDKTIIWNIGGNHILQNSMDNFEESFDKIVELFPNAWFITVPKIHSDLLEKFTSKKTKQQIDSEIIFMNDYIKSKAKNIIDIHPLTDFDGPIFIFVHEDLVHFSKKYDQKVRIPFIKKIVDI